MTITLAQISSRLPSEDLYLDAENLGDEAAALLAALRIVDRRVGLSSVQRNAEGDGWLEMSGVGNGFLGNDKIQLRLLLIDARDGRRNCIIRLEDSVPEKLITAWLGRFDSEPLEIFAEIGPAKSCFVSSIDLAGANLGQIALPRDWAPIDLAAGVTFGETKVGYDPEFIKGVKAQVGIELLSEEGVARIEGRPGADLQRLTLHLRPERVAASLSVGWLQIEAAPPRLLLPLMPDEFDGPRLIQPGKLTFDSSPYDVEAEFDLFAETAIVRFKTPPGFGVFKDYIGLPPNSVIDSFLEGAMGEAWLQRVWRRSGSTVQSDETVLALGGAVR